MYFDTSDTQCTYFVRGSITMTDLLLILFGFSWMKCLCWISNIFTCLVESKLVLCTVPYITARFEALNKFTPEKRAEFCYETRLVGAWFDYIMSWPCITVAQGRVANPLLSQELKLCFSDTKFTKAPYTKKDNRFFLDTKWDTEQYQILSHTKIIWWY